MQTDLATRQLGNTGLVVTQLGYGAGFRGEVTEAQADGLFNAVLDAGINFIDTAPCYDFSEDRIGAGISRRRDEFYLATKCGCNVGPGGKPRDPHHIWTAENFHGNIDESLRRMNVDYVDLLQMHSPSFKQFEQGGLLDALNQIRDSGKARFIGVSTNLPDLPAYMKIPDFDVFQISYSALGRRHERLIQDVADAGAGVIIRGGIAKGHRGEGWPKWERAGLDDLLDGMDRYAFVLRFTLTHPACQTNIVGTADLNHFKANVAAAKAGPLPQAVYEEAKERLAQIGEAPADSQGE